MKCVNSCVLVLLMLLRGSFGASFDCAKATTKIEKAICKNARLSELDEEMAMLYKGLRNSLTPRGKELLKQEQRYWLKERNKRYADANPDSLISSYEVRISALKFGYQDLSYYNGHYKIPHEISILGENDWEPMMVNDEFCFEFLSMDSVKFSLETVTTNGHTCSAGGIAVRNREGNYEWRSEPDYDDKICIIQLSVGDGHLFLGQGKESGGCRVNCGARAYIGDYTFTLKQRVDKKPCVLFEGP